MTYLGVGQLCGLEQNVRQTLVNRVVEVLPLQEDPLCLELALLGLDSAVVTENVHGLRGFVVSFLCLGDAAL